jgi:hypothetical protein
MGRLFKCREKRVLDWEEEEGAGDLRFKMALRIIKSPDHDVLSMLTTATNLPP